MSQEWMGCGGNGRISGKWWQHRIHVGWGVSCCRAGSPFMVASEGVEIGGKEANVGNAATVSFMLAVVDDWVTGDDPFVDPSKW
jgi:hypothetical protein